MPANATLQLRRDTASQWLISNPTLLAGEPGYEIDTGYFKIGNGTLSWAYLPYAGTPGSASSSILVLYGDGSDGSATISSGIMTLERDMFYNNLTLSGTGQIITNGFRLFVNGILDITAAAAGAIQWNGYPGNSATSSTGGTVGTALAAATVGPGSAGVVGGVGGTTTGTQGGAGAAQAVGNGGASGANGAGGNGYNGTSSNAGGAQRAGTSPTANFFIQRYATNLIKAVTLIGGGSGSPGGSGGGGDGTNAGGGGGAGGGAGGVVYICARTINRGAGTAVGAIQAKGAVAGNGWTPTGTIATNGAKGGGGGGSGGTGGWIFLMYGALTGSAATNALDVSGASGGNGGAPQINGSGTGTGGGGGAGGGSGTVTIIQVSGGTVGSNTTGAAGTAGTAGTSSTGGTGGAGATLQVSL